MIDGKAPHRFFPKRELGKFYITDPESGWPIECTEEQKKEYEENLKKIYAELWPKSLPREKAMIIVTGTAGSIDSSNELRDMFYDPSPYTIPNPWPDPEQVDMFTTCNTPLTTKKIKESIEGILDRFFHQFHQTAFPFIPIPEDFQRFSYPKGIIELMKRQGYIIAKPRFVGGSSYTALNILQGLPSLLIKKRQLLIPEKAESLKTKPCVFTQIENEVPWRHYHNVYDIGVVSEIYCPLWYNDEKQFRSYARSYELSKI